MKYKIALLPGDGVGEEVIQQAKKCLEAVEEVFHHEFIFQIGVIGAKAINTYETALPKDTLRICKNSDAILVGTIGDHKFNNNPVAEVRPEHGLIQLRKELGLYANIRPLRIFPSLVDKSPLKADIIKGTDMLIFRELSSGIYYQNKEDAPKTQSASDVCKYTEEEISRIAHLAFKAAKNRNNRVTLIDKANVLNSSKLWRKVVRDIAQSYPDVALEYQFVDHAAMKMIAAPNRYDVVLTENMFGDILADESSMISGAVNTLPSASIGEKQALFQPVHGPYTELKDKDLVNPVATILATAMLLEHFRLFEEAMAVREAVDKSIAKGIVTKDLDANSQYGTNHVGDFIANHILGHDDRINMNNENIDLGKSTII